MRRLALVVVTAIMAVLFQTAYHGPLNQVEEAFAAPTPSGAQPTQVVNGDFSGVGLGEVGTPPTNHDFETAGSTVGAPPTNYDFSTGDFTGWTLTGSPTIQSGGPGGYYAQLAGGHKIKSSAFAVDATAQALTFNVAAVNAGTFQWILKIYSGADYSTVTTKYYTSCPTTCTSWNSYSLDTIPWQGQSIKIEVQRYLGDLKVDDVAVGQVVLSGWTPTAGDKVSRETGGPTGAYGKVSTAIVSQPYTVDSNGQNGAVDLKVESSSGSYNIYVLSGPGYGTSTTVFSGTQADSSSWGTKTFGIGDFAGQSIKFKVVPAANTIVSVDRAAISRNEVPGWSAAGTGAVKPLGSEGGVGYLANVLEVRSAPLTLDYSSYYGNTRVNWFRVVYRMYSNINGQGTDVGSTLNVFFAGGVSPFWGTSGGSCTGCDPAGVWIERYFNIYNPNSPYTPVPQTGSQKIKGWPPPGTTNWKSPDVMFIQVVDGPGQNKILGAGECEDMDIVPDDMCPKKVTGSTPDPVELTSGNFFHAHTDLAIPGRGIPLRFTRSYSAQGSTNGVGTVGPLGVKWSHNWQASLTEFNSGNNAQVRLPGGSSLTWNKVSGVFQPPAGFEGTLVKNGDGTWTLTTKHKLVYAFSSAGRLTSITDRNGNTTTLAYDGNNRLATITDPGGRSLTLAYNADNRISSVSDPLGRSVSYGYDSNADLTTVTDVKTGTTTYQYSGHLLTQGTDSNGHLFVRNTYDTKGRVTQQLDALGGTTTIAYSTPGDGATRMTDQRGNQTTFYFDSQMRITDVVDHSGGVTTIAYDSDNNRTSVTNPLNRMWNYTYDSSGNVLTARDPLNNTSTLTYNSNNDLVTATDPLSRVASYVYDTAGNPTRAIRKDAGGVVKALTCFELNANGLPVTVVESTDLVVPPGATDPCTGNKTKLEYDTYGNATAVIDPRFSGQPTPPKTTLTYDLGGRTLTATNELAHTTAFTYDARNNVLTATDNLSNVASSAYDAKGILKAVTDPNRKAVGAPETGAACGAAGTGNGVDDDGDGVKDDGCPSAIYSYDNADRLTSVIDALGQTTSYGYDAAGNRTSVTNARGQTTSYAYDALNRLQSSTGPLSRVTSYQYDAASNLTQRTDARGLVTKYFPDALNRLDLLEHWNGQTLVDSVDYTYDVVSRRTQMIDPTGTTTYGYDALSRPTSITFPGPKTVSYQYDNVGNRSRITYPDTKYVDYTYDAAHNLATVTDWLTKQTTYTYDNAGQLTKTQLPNSVWTDYSYDNADRLTSVANKKPGPITISSFTYTLDATGNRTQMADLSGTHQYQYDALYRLTQVTYPGPQTDTYTYDAVGNRLTKNATAYTYDNADEMLTAGGVAYGYDSNGNQASRGSDTFAYDHENRLTQSVIGGATSSSVYNGDGLRMSHTVSGQATNYTWDIAARLPVVLQDGTNTYVYGLDLISATDASGAQTYSTYDGLGSTTDLTDAAGFVTDTYSYDAFGAIRSQTGGSSNYWLFTGEQRDSDSGLYFLRARYYDPSTGRLLSRDPFKGASGVPNTQHPYMYALASPVNFTDPSGLCIVICPRDLPSPGDVLDEAGDVAGDVLDEAGDVVDEVLDPAFDFLTDPETLIAIGQAIGGGAILIGCLSGGLANPLCDAGIVLYVLVSAWELERADTVCERMWSAFSSALGALPVEGGVWRISVAVGSGAGDSMICQFPDAGPVYASGTDKE